VLDILDRWPHFLQARRDPSCDRSHGVALTSLTRYALLGLASVLFAWRGQVGAAYRPPRGRQSSRGQSRVPGEHEPRDSARLEWQHGHDGTVLVRRSYKEQRECRSAGASIGRSLMAILNICWISLGIEAANRNQRRAFDLRSCVDATPSLGIEAQENEFRFASRWQVSSRRTVGMLADPADSADWIGNAIKFTDAGSICVSLLVAIYDRRFALALSGRDTGIDTDDKVSGHFRSRYAC